MRQTAEANKYETVPSRTPRPIFTRAPESQAVTIRCYEDDIPAFIGPELKRLYQNHYTTLEHLGQAGRLAGASAYVARRGHENIAIFLFRREGRTVKVLNEVISVEGEEIRRFSDYVFAAFAAVKVICFSAVHADLHGFPYVHQKLNRLEDIVAALPSDAEQYTSGLGKKTRTNLRRYQKIAKQDFPSFAFRTLEGRQIELEHVRAVMDLYAKRMAEKNKVLLSSELGVERLTRLVRENGLLGIVTIDGRICAGAITCRIGANAFLRVLAHDPAYNKYSIGTLCCYLTIVESIGRGAREFHFLWGESNYKYLLGGVRRDLDRIVVYRSAPQFLLNGGLAFKEWFNSLTRKAGKWVQQARTQERTAARIAVAAIDYARGFKRSRFVTFSGMAFWSVFCEPIDRLSEQALIPFMILA